MRHDHKRSLTPNTILRVSLATGLALALGAAVAPAPAQSTAPAASAAPAKDLPAAKKLIDRGIEAMGGRKAIDAVKSQHVKIAIQGAGQAAPMNLEIFTSGEDKLLGKQPVPQMGGMILTFGRNGEKAWVDSAMTGTREVPLAQISQIREMATLPMLLSTLEKEFNTLETVGEADVNGTPCFRIRLADRKKPEPMAPKGDIFLMLDARTFLPVSVETPQANPSAPTQTVHIGEWKKFGDLKLFTKVDSMQGGQKQSIVYEVIEFNNVDESMFEVPAALGSAADPGAPTGPTAKPAAKPGGATGKTGGGTGTSGGSR